MAKKQYIMTLEGALHDGSVRRALNQLAGRPFGGWPETAQAMRQISDELPHQEHRTFTLDELIVAAMEIDSMDRYQWRANMPPDADDSLVDLAAGVLRAVLTHDGTWVYYADEMDRWVRVNEADLLMFAEYLTDEDPLVRDTAYARWVENVWLEEIA